MANAKAYWTNGSTSCTWQVLVSSIRSYSADELFSLAKHIFIHSRPFSIDMNCITSKLHQIEPNQVDPALGFGTFACVSRITGTNLAIKVPFADAVHHIPNEQSIYERLGEHHLILKYYHKTAYITGGRTIPGLVLQFLEAGTLADNLNTPRWVENRDE